MVHGTLYLPYSFYKVICQHHQTHPMLSQNALSKYPSSLARDCGIRLLSSCYRIINIAIPQHWLHSDVHSHLGHSLIPIHVGCTLFCWRWHGCRSILRRFLIHLSRDIWRLRGRSGCFCRTASQQIMLPLFFSSSFSSSLRGRDAETMVFLSSWFWYQAAWFVVSFV